MQSEDIDYLNETERLLEVYAVASPPAMQLAYAMKRVEMTHRDSTTVLVSESFG